MVFFIITFLIFVSAAEIDICVPSFPQISDEFGLTPFMTELLLGLNLLFHCLASLFAGNFGDRYGKKRMIIIGMLIFIFGSYLCYIANSYYILLLARIIQGIGVAMPMVLAPLLIMDFYEKEQQQKMMTLLNGFCTLGIAAAPALGSYITLYFGWRFVFVTLTILGILALMLVASLIKPDLSSEAKIKISLAEYLPVLKSKLAMIYIISLCLSIGAYYSFVAMAPIVYVKSLGVSLKDLGFYQGALTLTFGIFSIITPKIVDIFGQRKIFFLSVFLVIISILLCIVATLFNLKSPLYITLILLVSSIAWVYPINLLYVVALRSVAGAEGRISAAINISKWIFSILGFQLASYFYSNDFQSTGVMMNIMNIGSIGLIFYLYFKDQSFRDEVRKEV
jgi:DHA1 family bicyclomycin/chloramphenicol resistance-like MFS transporter